MMDETRFLKACRGETTDRTPVWIMRQAGRYLPEYRDLRRRHGMLEICRTPDLAREATMQPLGRFDLDAAILFSDLLVPVAAIGVDFDIVERRGPVVGAPVRTREAVRALRPPGDLRALEFVFEAIRLIKRAIAAEGRSVPLIGFAGAPFTVASYLIEGGASRDLRETRLMMHQDPDAWDDLLARLADLLASYVEEQARAGVDAVQIFDSWIGCVSPAEYRRHLLEPTRRVLAAAARCGIPSIHFGTQTSGLLEVMAEAGGDVIGVDWRITLSEVRRRCPGRAVQGNLDPLAMLAPRDVLVRMIEDVLQDAGTSPGHVFNLGHGILPETPIENVHCLVDTVHARTARTA